MSKSAILSLMIFVTLSTNGQDEICGEYQTNFPTYGMFTEILILNCDSTVILNFRGDLMNDSSYGKWSVDRGQLTIQFDTLKKSRSRYTGTMELTINRHRLIPIKFTKANYLELKTEIDKHNLATGDSLKIPDFDMLNNTPKNFYGNEGKQFYKRIRRFNCRLEAANAIKS